MNTTTFTNIITILFCTAVLVQSVRLMRSIQTMKNGDLARTVDALDKATAKARVVLNDLKQTLAGDGVAVSRTLSQATEIREELTVMVGIANAVAERLVEAASPPPQKKPAPKAKPKAAPKAKRERKPRAPRAAKPAVAAVTPITLVSPVSLVPQSTAKPKMEQAA